MDQQTTLDGSSQVSGFDVRLDNNAADICTSCRALIQTGEPEFGKLRIEFPSSTCSICRLLNKCMPGARLIRYTKRKVIDQHNELGWENIHRFKHIVMVGALFEMTHNTHWYTFLVSDLTLEEVETTFQSFLSPPLVSLARVKEYLQACVTGHGQKCVPEAHQKLLHLRVIDCHTRMVVDAPANCHFVALSYVWGETSVTENFSLLETMPLTIAHSIHVTVELGFKYLWVDRYCINQLDQQHREDQISQMSTIYSAAQLTIVAAAGSDPTHGLPGVALHPRPLLVAHHEKLGPLSLSALQYEAYISQNTMRSLKAVAESVWSSRAWTYQEAMFSRRRLIFTDKQAFVSCNTRTWFESGAVVSRSNSDLPNLPWYDRAADRWGYEYEYESDDGEFGGSSNKDYNLQRTLENMEMYCERTLSHDSDALNAIVSTLNVLLNQWSFHIWGVPVRVIYSSHTAREVPHQTHQQTLPKETTKFHISKVKTYFSWSSQSEGRRRLGFPSWSPLGWSSGRVFWKGTPEYNGPISIQTPSGPHDISEYIQCARTEPTKVPQQLSLVLKTTAVEVCEDGNVAFLLEYNFQIRVSVAWNGTRPAVGSLLKAAVISDSYPSSILLLHGVGGGVYERCGFCTLGDWTFDLMQNAWQAALWYKDPETKSLHKMFGDSGTYQETPEEEKLDPIEEARLSAHLQKYEKYEWWDDLYARERIILG